MTAPDVRGRLRAIRARGGRIVVVDPAARGRRRRPTSTSPSGPGPTPSSSWRWCTCSSTEDLVDLGDAAPHVAGVERCASWRSAAPRRTPRSAAGSTRNGPPARARARRRRPRGGLRADRDDDAALRHAASWLVDVLNTLTGNLDRPGGAMFATPAAGVGNTTAPRARPGCAASRHASRVRGLPEVFGELPVAALAEEIETPGPGQVRALLTIAGNPVLSTPNAGRLDAALAQAGLHGQRRPLPQRDDAPRRRGAAGALAAGALALRPRLHGLLDPRRRELLARGGRAAAGRARRVGDARAPLGDRHRPGRGADVAAIDDVIATEAVRRAVGDEHSPLAGRDVDEVLAELAPRTGPERLLDLALRTGPYRLDAGRPRGGARTAWTSARSSRACPRSCGRRAGRSSSRPSRCWPTAAACVEALGEPTPSDEQMLLIGRRDLRSNNSWMHNLPVLVRGKARCTAHVHPDDAARLGLVDGAPARVTSRDRDDRGPRRAHRGHPPGRRVDPARVGPRRRRRAARRGGRARRGQLERPRRRGAPRAGDRAPPSSTASR